VAGKFVFAKGATSVEGAGIRNVIEQVLDVEGQAREIVSQAEQQSREILKRAQEDAQHIIETAKHEAVEQVHRETKRTLEEAEKQRDERIAEEMTKDALFVEKSRQKVPRAVEMIVREILGG
jgi:vacuolar-type H+-ATPase subunit H